MNRPACFCISTFIKAAFFALLVVAPGAVTADPPPETMLPDNDDSTAPATNAGTGNAPPESALGNPDDSTTVLGPKPPVPATDSDGPQKVAIRKEGEMWVWPAGGIAGRPLIFACHGSGGNGQGEIGGWIYLAKQHNFTIVCPSLINNPYAIKGEKDYFDDMLKWIKGNLKYDAANTYMTGFSAGGLFTWWVGTSRPDFFRGLFFQSANYYGADVSRWYNRPVRMIWGSEDIPHIITQNEQAAAMLHGSHCKTWTTDVIQGAHHQPHHDMVVAWMEQVMAPPAAAPTAPTGNLLPDESN